MSYNTQYPADGATIRFQEIGQIVSGIDGNGQPQSLAAAVASGIVPVSVTPHFVAMGASGSQVIPAGAKGWSFTLLTGTGTIGGAAVGAVFSDSDPNTLLVAITVTTGAVSSAYVRWNT